MGTTLPAGVIRSPLLHEAGQTCLPDGLLHQLFLKLLKHTYVFADRIVKDKHILLNDGYDVEYTVRLHRADFLTVHGDVSFVIGVASHDQAQKSGLSASGSPHDGIALARFKPKRHIP